MKAKREVPAGRSSATREKTPPGRGRLPRAGESAATPGRATVRRGGDRHRGSDGRARTAARRPADAPARRGGPRGGKAAAPAREPRTVRPGPQTTPIKRQARAKNTDQAKARAKARKAKAPKIVRVPLRERLIARLASIDLRPRTLAAKVPFVVLVIGSLGVGLAVTLWLSTDAAERSYQLGNARETNQALMQQKEALERDVLKEQAAPALAEAARNLGMIPSKDTAHLVQDPTGNWIVVGTPKPAEGAPPPPLNTKLPDPGPAAPVTTAPGPKPPNPVEVPVRVPPGTGAAAAAPGAEVPVRAPALPGGATPLDTRHAPGVPADAAAVPATGPAPGPVEAPPAIPAPPTVDAPQALVPAPAGEQVIPVPTATPGAPQ